MVALTGDGGFLFGGAELATAVQHGINLVTVLFNNPSYGNVLRDQRRLFEGRESGSSLRNPDFQTYARAFGVPSWRVTDAGGLRDALSQAIKANAPTLIEVVTDITQEYAPWEFIVPGACHDGIIRSGGSTMKFGMFYEHQLPQPWGEELPSAG